MVSVIIPVYNRADKVGETIASVLAQTMPDWELILVDDGSNDETPEVLNSWALQDRRIQVVRTVNQGQNVARNVGLSHAGGEFVRFLDHDDSLFPWSLEMQGSILQNSRLMLVAGPVWGVHEQDFAQKFTEISSEHQSQSAEKQAIEEFPDVYALNDAYHPTFNEITVRRAVLEQAGGFPQRRGTCEEFRVLMALQLTSEDTRCLRHGPIPCVLKRLYKESLAGYYWNHEPARWPMVSLCEAAILALEKGKTSEVKFRRYIAGQLYSTAIVAWRNGWKKEALEGVQLARRLRAPFPRLSPKWHGWLHRLVGFAAAEATLQKMRSLRVGGSPPKSPGPTL